MTQKELNLKSIMDKLIAGGLTTQEAAGRAHKSLRQIVRIKKRYERDGDIGLIHKARWRKSNHAYDASRYDAAVSIIQRYYSDYSYVMIQEKLEEKHSIILSMPTIRNELIRRGIRTVKKQKKPDTQRTMRERKPNYGEMIQYDGTYHRWFEDRWEEVCLLVSVDDATWEVVARFDVNEGIRATFEFWMEYIRTYGKPKSIYLDRFATYKINHPNATDDKELVTQFGRVCQELGIELIFANSPQAKGRVERMNGTLQDRLLKELRENNISNIADANVFLWEYLPKFNKKFLVDPRENSDLHISLRDDERAHLDQIFCVQETRKVMNDFTIRFESKVIQLYRDKTGWSCVYKGETVTVEKRMDGSIHIRNKNKKSVLSKIVDICNTSRKSPACPLPPVAWESEGEAKKELRRQQEQDDQKRKEEHERKLQKKKEQEASRQRMSKERQAYHKEHGRLSKFHPTILTSDIDPIIQMHDVPSPPSP